MGRCTEDVFNKISYKNIKSNGNFEVDFTVQDNLQSCKKVNTKYPVSQVEDCPAYYDRNLIPDNVFECNRQGCVNGGTYKFTLETGKTLCGGVYRANYDALEWLGGIVTFYAKIEADTTVKFEISDTDAFTNSDTFTFNLKFADADFNGFIPVVVDLLHGTLTEKGTGWEATTSGAYIKITGDKSFGVSTITIFDEIEDFDVNDTVKIGCVQSIAGDNNLDVIEKKCASAQYSNDITGIEVTVSGNTATPNYWLLNPRLRSTTDFLGSINVTDEKTVVAETINGRDYGVIEVPDAYGFECMYYGAQISGEGCSVTEDTLVRSNIPTPVSLDIKHFQVIKQDNGVKFVFNKDLVGSAMLISYPQQVEIERQEATKDAVGERRTTMRYTKETSDGEKYIYTYKNVFVTKFPENINNSDENTFEFTLNIQPDLLGRYYTRDRVLV